MIIGMDFGTTNSGMSVYDGDTLQLIPLDPSNRNNNVVPTALYITNDRAVHIGKDATNTYYEQNLNRPSKLEKVWVGEVKMTFAEVGTFYRDVYIDKDIYAPGRLFLSFKMGLSSPTYLGTIVGNQYFLLEDIIATYLYATKHRAEQHLGCEVDSIVFGRPVRYSDEAQHNDIARDRMIQAAFKAGYKTVYLQYEPIAAAFYYEMGIQDEQNVLIFDFGGGTLDLSIVNVGNPKTRRVIANGGIP
ncbi:MAG: Hsp70 family protein, partial [Chloroflexota bacterium]